MGLILAVVIWLLAPQAPPPCATEMSPQLALNLFKGELIHRGYLAVEISTFEVKSFVRKDEDNWPTYFVRFEGSRAAAPRVFLATGNGCGFYEVMDLTNS